MSTPDQDGDNVAPSRHSFRKDKLEAALALPTYGGGQTTLNGKDAPIPLHLLQPGRNVEDNTPSVNASIWDSPIMQEYIEKLGGEKGVEEKFNEIANGKKKDEEDPDSDLDEPLILLTPAKQPAPISVDKAPSAVERPVRSVEEDDMAEINRLASQAFQNNPRVGSPTFYEDFPLTPDPAPRRQRLVRAEVQSDNSCVDSTCGAILPPGAKFCAECGKPQLGRHCTECGIKFNGNEKFCPMCGTVR